MISLLLLEKIAQLFLGLLFGFILLATLVEDGIKRIVRHVRKKRASETHGPAAQSQGS